MNNDRKYYYRKQLEILAEVEKLDVKPTLLLHCCCGPCSTTCLHTIYQHFDVTIYYSNSNIYPKEEYDKRLNTLKDFIPKYNRDYHSNVKIIEDEYDNIAYTICIKHLKDEKEGGGRCHLCYRMRLEKTFEYATKHHFDYITTTLTLSRQKNSMKINEIATDISHNYPTIKYFYSDFKKNCGIDLSIKLTNLYDMYRQDYCGCVYSYQNRKTNN